MKDINIPEKLVNIFDILVIKIIEESQSVSKDNIEIKNFEKINNDIKNKKHEDINKIINHDDFMLQQLKGTTKISEKTFKEEATRISSILLGVSLVRKLIFLL